MKKMYLLLLCCSFLNFAYSQNHELEFAFSLGGNGSDHVVDFVTDEQGNIYTTGEFKNLVDFDPSPDFQELESPFNTNVFIAKYTSNGSLLWAKQIGGSQADYSVGIVSDNDGNIIVAGIFRGTADFDPGPAESLISTVGDEEPFVLKLDSNGNFIWAKKLSCSDYGATTNIITAGNSIYLSGYFNGEIDLDPGTGVVQVFSGLLTHAFQIKLDADGNYIWGTTYGNQIDDAYIYRSVVHADHVYTIGEYGGTIDIDPSGDVVEISGNGPHLFIQKVELNGDLAWAKTINLNGNNYELSSLIIDKNNNILVGGSFGSTIDFDPGPGMFNLTANFAEEDIFLLKLTEEGDFIWAKSIGNEGIERWANIAIDIFNNIYLSGIFTQTTDFNPDENEVFEMTPLNNQFFGGDAFILKLTENGDFIWARAIQGEDEKYITSLSIDPFGNLIASGFFESTIDINPNENEVTEISSNGNFDGFILKLGDATTVGTEEIFTTDEWSIFPNPTSGNLSIELKNEGRYEIEVFNMIGQLVYESNQVDFPIHHFELDVAPGIYIVELNNGTEKYATKVVNQ